MFSFRKRTSPNDCRAVRLQAINWAASQPITRAFRPECRDRWLAQPLQGLNSNWRSGTIHHAYSSRVKRIHLINSCESTYIMTANGDKRNLIEYVGRSLESEEEFHFLRFEFLQRLNIVQQEVDLVRTKSRFQREGNVSEEDLTGLKVKLEDYSKRSCLEPPRAPDNNTIQARAIRNYQYLRSKKGLEKNEMRNRKRLLQRFFQSQDDFNDPFHSHYSYFHDADEEVDPFRAAIMRYLPARLTYSHEERLERKKEFIERKTPKIVSAFVDRLVRFIIAFTGGIFLVVPMIIMVVHQSSQTKSLVTVSVAVTLFALILSFGIRVSNVETLVSTATYAAVLVVFVGTSSSGGGGTP